MNTRAPVRRALGVVLLVLGALLAAAPGANAAEEGLPKPDAPRLTSAVVIGCQAPCASGTSGKLVLTWTNPSAPDGAIVLNYAYADGFNIGGPTSIARDGDAVEMHFPICAAVNVPSPECYRTRVDALRGAELMTVTARFATGNPDDGSLRISAESAQSNGLKPTGATG